MFQRGADGVRDSRGVSGLVIHGSAERVRRGIDLPLFALPRLRRVGSSGLKRKNRPLGHCNFANSPPSGLFSCFELRVVELACRKLELGEFTRGSAQLALFVASGNFCLTHSIKLSAVLSHGAAVACTFTNNLPSTAGVFTVTVTIWVVPAVRKVSLLEAGAQVTRSVEVRTV